MISVHKRRPGYWTYYEKARKNEEEFVTNMTIELIQQYPHPPRRKSPRGCPPTHSRNKLDFACFDMTSSNNSYRNERDRLLSMRSIWDESLPTHKELVTHMQTISLDWLDLLVAKTAFLCLEELTISNATAPLGVDSSAFGTTRYTYSESQNMTLDDYFSAGTNVPRVKTYLKFHITAILGHQIILTAITTPSNVHDSKVVSIMFEMIKKFGFDFYGRAFLADRAYDSEYIFMLVFAMNMIPIIKQRVYSNKQNNLTVPANTCRELAAKIFDPSLYNTRLLIEGIFGAEESKRNQLHCRLLLEENRNRYSKFRAIAWNLRVLNRFRCANELGIPIPSYGDLENNQIVPNLQSTLA